ncbi:MAG: lysophospholipid acyltransferase family protein [Hyphomicrobiaceae bacterium]|nr:lysophospholipid acyltransferase family protein [Hyphomicrobiaceae bacterium]
MALTSDYEPDTTEPSKVRFSYSSPDQTKLQQFLIKTVEKLGGQPRLKRLYETHREVLRPGETFFDAAVRQLQLDIRYDEAPLAAVPKTGPVVFIANHPYGVLDGVVFAWLAMKARPDVRVLANSVLCRLPEARDNLYPVDFADTKEARTTTLSTLIAAQKFMKHGGAVAIFPGGGVSTSEKPLKGPALDFAWAPFTAKLIESTGATVVPMYFAGQNSRLFQLASHLSLTWRLSLIFGETTRRIGTRLDVRIGDPVPAEAFKGLDRDALLADLRQRVYALAGRADVDYMRLGKIRMPKSAKPAKADDRKVA